MKMNPVLKTDRAPARHHAFTLVELLLVLVILGILAAIVIPKFSGRTEQARDAQNWHGPYLQTDTIPKDPWGNDYIYKFPGGHAPLPYDLNSMGPPGGAKLIANWTVQKR